mgnify:FL=1
MRRSRFEEDLILLRSSVQLASINCKEVHRMRRLGMIIGLCAILALAGTVYCLAAAKPAGKVVLTVTGAITETNSDKGFELDMAMLEGIGTKLYEGTDPWLGKKKYTGVVIADILKFAGAPKDVAEVIVIAKDGKKVTLKAEDVDKYAIMLATQDAGKAIGSGLGGPVKLVFPYTTHPELEKMYPKDDWNWFVVTLEVKVK